MLVLMLYLVQRQRQAHAPGHPIVRLPLDIRQSASGWTLTRAEGGRTLFRAQAASAVRLRSGERAVLKQVRVELFEAQGGRVDQIYGDEFDYDPGRNEISAQGLVHIDLAGTRAASETAESTLPPPEESGNPIHIETNNLVFNTKTGNGDVQHGLEFRYLNATGRADTAHISTHPENVVLGGNVQLDWVRSGQPVLHVEAQRVTLDRSSLQVVLTDHALVRNGTQELRSERFEMQLRPDYSVASAQAVGNVMAQDATPSGQLTAHAHLAVADLSSPTTVSGRSGAGPAAGWGKERLQGMRLSGAVDLLQQNADQTSELQAGAVSFHFGPGDQLEKIEVRDGARVTQDLRQAQRHLSPPALLSTGMAGNRRTLTASGLDLYFAGRRTAARNTTGLGSLGSELTRVVVLGRGHLHSASATGTVGSLDAEADQMEMRWRPGNRLTQANANGHVVLGQTVAQAAVILNRHSTAESVELAFSPQDGQLQQVWESGQVELDERTAPGQTSILRADRVHYAASAARVSLSADQGSAYTHGKVSGEAPQLRFAASSAVWDRTTGEVTGDGGVQVSFLPSPLASATPGSPAGLAVAGPMFGNARVPVDVVSDHMQVNLTSKQGRFTGHARIFQGSNLTSGTEISFDRTHGTLVVRDVTSMFVNPSAAMRTRATLPPVTGAGDYSLPGGIKNGGAPSPVTVSAQRLTYSDTDHEARYRGTVRLVNRDVVMTAPVLDVFLTAPGDRGAQRNASAPAGLQRVVASGGVRITQPGREATAERAVYEGNSDEVVLTGEGSGAPSIFDAEQGRLTGHTLTFSPSSDTIRVESELGKRLRVEHPVKP